MDPTGKKRGREGGRRQDFGLMCLAWDVHGASEGERLHAGCGVQELGLRLQGNVNMGAVAYAWHTEPWPV